MSGSVSPLPWTGNKGCIYTTIDAFMPPHRTYVEACMGSAEVFLRKKPVEKEIINDYNGDLVRFFRVLQRNENLERLIGRLFLSFNSEQIFRANKALLAEVPNILDDLTETSVIIENTQWNDFDLAVAFYENQVFSFSSTGKNFAITKKDMTKRFGRLIAACARLRNATIMHRDYKDCISYGAGEDAFILLDPPYKGTEDYYQKSSFGSDEHAKLFGFMNEVHEQFHGSCKFLITYNNDPYIRELADHYGFDSFVQERLHNMRQATKPGDTATLVIIGSCAFLRIFIAALKAIHIEFTHIVTDLIKILDQLAVCHVFTSLTVFQFNISYFRKRITEKRLRTRIENTLLKKTSHSKSADRLSYHLLLSFFHSTPQMPF